MFANVLIANRGEIACRIARTARRMGLKTLALATPADRGALFTRLADETHEIGVGAEGYLDAEAIIALAVRVGAHALHPGYGFLAENADFAEGCARAGIVFVGPPPAAMRAMGLKSSAKALMAKAGAPIVPGYHGDNQSPRFLKEKAYEIGYPVLIKAIAGGGGRGMRRVDAHVDFEFALEAAAREAAAAFGDPRVLIEKLIAAPRHVEVQVFGDARGGVVHLFERDCSLQRRHQKVIEESPAPGLPEATARAMYEAAVTAARAVGYVGAGTVEFIVDASRGLGLDCFYFLEMNTRLQVEHPVTEAVTGLDLVEWQLRVAAGEPLPLKQREIRRSGWAVEARLNAEDPENGFLPSPGEILALRLEPGAGLRLDAGVEAGDAVTPFYNSMIAKLIAHAPTRAEALAKLGDALARAVVIGPKTNLAFLSALVRASEVEAGGRRHRLYRRPRGATRRRAAPSRPARRACRRRGADRGGGASRELRPAIRSLECRRQLRTHRAAPRRIRGPRRRPSRAPGGDRGGRAANPRLRRRPRAHPGGEAPTPTVLTTEGGAFVLSGGRQILIARVDPSEGGLVGAAAGSGEIVAPMHGRVIALHVEHDARVDEGARLAVIEAMKMEHALVAPRTGRVANLIARVGDTVEQGQRLMTIEAEEE